MNPGPRDSSLGQEGLEELGRHREPRALMAYIDQRPELLRSNIVKELAEAVRQQVRVDVERASNLAEAALAIARKIGDAESLGYGSRAKANALWFGSQLKPAVELFQVALNYFERAGAAEEAGRTLSSSIQPLMLLGEYERALESANRAREIFQRAGDLWRLARLEINVANIHQRHARFAEALAGYQLAYNQLQIHKDQEGMAAALHNMAVCLIMLNDFDRALKTYQCTRQVAANNNMPMVVAQADYNIAYLYFLRGDYQNAIERLGAARQLWRKNENEYHSALCDLDESEIYLEVNFTTEAARMADRARKQFEKLGIAYEAARALVNSAIALDQQHESAAALKLFGEAAEIFAREENAAWLALIGLYRALVLWETGHAEAALEPCRGALEFFLQAGLERRAILCHLLLARIWQALELPAVAEEQCGAALRKLALVEAPLLSYHAHLIMGDLERARGKSNQSYRWYRNARRNLETLRGSLQGEELKIAFMKNRTGVYEKLVGLCLEKKSHGAAAMAFRYMEQAKSRALVELIFGRSTPLDWLGRTEAGQRLARLRQELNWYYRRLEIEQTRREGLATARIQNLQSEARSLEDELIQAIHELPRGSAPEIAVDPPRPLTVEEIRAALDEQTTLLEYFQVESQLIVAVLTRRQLEIIPLCDINGIASSIRMLEFQLSKMSLKRFHQRELSQEMPQFVECRLQQLYKLLIAPFSESLTGRHLIIIPHGILHYLPFHALLDGNEYLIDRFTISYAPSAGIYALCQWKTVNRTGPALLLGVQDKRAPWIRREIYSVADVLPNAQIHLGAEATTGALKIAGASSRLIHIATHAVFRRDNPMFSSVRLADSYLNVYDLYQLKLPVELLTLSGCGTGLSSVAAGDELLGLIRGLLSAGAKSLLLSLWDVHDRTTAQLMASFYSCLQEHGNKAVALRDAMLNLRESHPHPYYWAPFVLVGGGLHFRG